MKADDEVRRALDNAKIVPLRPEARQDKAGKAPRELSTVWADDITIDMDAGGLVDGLLAATGMTVLYGESGCGKTFVAVDLACHVAAGLPWRGMAVEQGVVVYVAAESPESVKRRLWAWKRHHRVEQLPVLVVQSAVDLLNGDTDTLAGLLEGLRAEHGRIALVVVDTLARAMTGNENAPDDMGRFVAACGRLREAGGTHAMVVHHCGKDAARGARGHSSLRAATDVELEVASGEGGGSVRVTKHRDEAGGASYGFKLEQVELGTNAKGRVVTTCVAVACDPPDRATAAERRPWAVTRRSCSRPWPPRSSTTASRRRRPSTYRRWCGSRRSPGGATRPCATCRSRKPRGRTRPSTERWPRSWPGAGCATSTATPG
jgi:KaiC/GvpD/RAD55 family RecA-like ATPase